jgi:hypothetical protein
MARSSNSLSRAFAQADLAYWSLPFDASDDEVTRPVALGFLIGALESEPTLQVCLDTPSPCDLQVDDEIEVPRPDDGRR